MAESPSQPSADNTASLPADYTTLLLGVASIVAGVATGLFSDLRALGQVVGVLAFAAWVTAIGLILWGPRSRTLARLIAAIAFILTVVLLLYAFVTGPRLNSRTLVLTPEGLRIADAACPGAVTGSEVAARVALSQLNDQFVHVELIEPGCEQADDDIRIRSEDLQGVLPAP